MSEIQFNCPECGHSLAVDSAGAGMLVPCPECQKQITIPAGPPSPPPIGSNMTPPVMEKPNKKNRLPVIGLALGILGLWFMGLLAAIPAVICAHIAKGRARKDPTGNGKGIAKAGLVVGYMAVLTVFIGPCGIYGSRWRDSDNPGIEVSSGGAKQSGSTSMASGYPDAQDNSDYPMIGPFKLGASKADVTHDLHNVGIQLIDSEWPVEYGVEKLYVSNLTAHSRLFPDNIKTVTLYFTDERLSKLSYVFPPMGAIFTDSGVYPANTREKLKKLLLEKYSTQLDSFLDYTEWGSITSVNSLDESIYLRDLIAPNIWYGPQLYSTHDGDIIFSSGKHLIVTYREGKINPVFNVPSEIWIQYYFSPEISKYWKKWSKTIRNNESEKLSIRKNKDDEEKRRRDGIHALELNKI